MILYHLVTKLSKVKQITHYILPKVHSLSRMWFL